MLGALQQQWRQPDLRAWVENGVELDLRARALGYTHAQQNCCCDAQKPVSQDVGAALPLQQTAAASEQLSKHSRPIAVPIAPGCVPPLPCGQQKLPTGKNEVGTQFPESHSPGAAHRVNRGLRPPDWAAAAVGATIDTIVGNAAIDTSPARLMASLRLMPANGDR